jgi:hypothetical protein
MALGFALGSVCFGAASIASQWASVPRPAIGVTFFAGSILFTLAAYIDLRVWAPDVFGSICFLAASELALAEVCGRWFCVRGRSLPWRIVALNLLGSVAFGVSAVTSLIVPSTDEPVSAGITNATTTLGALCFLAGAVLLLPEEKREREAAGARDAREAVADDREVVRTPQGARPG